MSPKIITPIRAVSLPLIAGGAVLNKMNGISNSAHFFKPQRNVNDYSMPINDAFIPSVFNKNKEDSVDQEFQDLYIKYKSENNDVNRMFIELVNRNILDPDVKYYFELLDIALDKEFKGDKNKISDCCKKLLNTSNEVLSLFVNSNYYDFDTYLKYADKIPKNVMEDLDINNNRFHYVLMVLKSLDDYESIKKNDNKNYSWKNTVNKKLNKLKKVVYNNPDSYINGNFSSENDKIRLIDKFFSKNEFILYSLLATLDNETLDYLMKKRFDSVTNVLNKVLLWNKDDLILLENLCKCSKINNEKLTPEEKLSFIDLIEMYKTVSKDITDNDIKSEKYTYTLKKQKENLKNTVKTGFIDIEKLQKEMFITSLYWSGLKKEDIEKIPEEIINKWNFKYSSDIIKELNNFNLTNHRDLKNILVNTNYKDFKTYIHDTSNMYGQTNLKTQKIFQKEKLNYNKWVNPRKDLNIIFRKNNPEKEFLENVGEIVEVYINMLLKGNLKQYLKTKILREYIDTSNNVFKIPDEIIKDKTNLKNFINNLINKLNPVWKRAEENQQTSSNARYTLSVKNKLNHLLKQINEKDFNKGIEDIDLTIKSWERDPFKDLFQGFYSTNCLKLGGSKSDDMNTYLLNTSLNMVEVINNKNGETIGNALIYFVRDADGYPSLVIDNAEINNSIKFEPETSRSLLMNIAEYVSELGHDVSGKDIPVYIGVGSPFNDLEIPNTISDVIQIKSGINFIGMLHCDSIYTDVYGHNVNFNAPYPLVKMGNLIRLM